MNIDHLKLFVRLASTSNISLAGQEFGLSPAVASAHISKLENSLNVRLVHRTTRKVSLTQEGLAFLPHAEGILESVEAALASVGAGDPNRTPKGVLRVSAPASFGRMHLIPAMQKFMDTYLGLKVDYHLSDSIIDLVEGGFDVAIRNAVLKDSTLVARKLASDNRIVVASPKYLIEHGTPTHPNDLLKHKFVNLSGIESWTFDTPEGPLNIKSKGDFQADNGEAVRDACTYGLGITASSIWCCYEHIKRGDLVQILEGFPLISDAAIWAIYPSSRLLAPKVRVFIDFLTEYLGPIPYWELNTKQIINLDI